MARRVDVLCADAAAYERMDTVTNLGTALLRGCGGDNADDNAEVVEAVGPSFFTPHVDALRVRLFLVWR